MDILDNKRKICEIQKKIYTLKKVLTDCEIVLNDIETAKRFRDNRLGEIGNRELETVLQNMEYTIPDTEYIGYGVEDELSEIGYYWRERFDFYDDEVLNDKGIK